MLQVTVPAGQQVMTFLYGYQRDPAYWPAALEFKPERWLPVRPANSRQQTQLLQSSPWLC
jgi:cytochrome P450